MKAKNINLFLIIFFILSISFVLQNSFAADLIHKTNSGIHYLKQIKNTEPKQLKEQSKSLADEQGIEVSIRFKKVLSANEIKSYKAKGVLFKMLSKNMPVVVGNIYRAKVSWELLDELIQDKNVEWIESVYHVAPAQPLDIANPIVEADKAWLNTNSLGDSLTGKGILIGDLDWGCDIYHPDFYRADGPIYEWIDVNGNGVFDSRIDAVDLNYDTKATTDTIPTELLAFFDGVIKEPHHGTITNNDGIFQADSDWLYNDKNNNGSRDFGLANGYTESDPTYGELFFLVNDVNKNNMLDVGETLQSLKTCKIKYYYTNTGAILERGINLINLTNYSTSERGVHGTGVCSILAGQERGFGRKYVGIAPDCDIAHATVWNAYDYVTIMAWMKSINVNVMLHEYSEWTSQFMDGSSNVEMAITNYALNDNIPSAIPSGNLGRSDKHALADVPSSGTLQVGFDTPSTRNIKTVYLSILWRDSLNTMTLTLTNPNSVVAHLGSIPPGTPNTEMPNTKIYDTLSVSTRGTVLRDLTISANTGYLLKGNWIISLDNAQDTTETVDLYIIDNQSSWYSDGAEFITHYTRDGNATWPMWADEGIGVGSFATRGIDASDPYYASADPGDLSGFSGRGARIDGVNCLTICAPGNYDIISSRSPAAGYPYGSYSYMSGTSASGPFVAAACALVRQANPSLSAHDIKMLLKDTAKRDSFTGPIPDENIWGGGKLDINAAVEQTLIPSRISHWYLY